MSSLVLYGKPSYAYNVIKDKLTKIIDYAELGLRLKEVQDISKFIEAGIDEIPAVLFQNTIYRVNGGSVEELADKVVFNILESENYGSLKRIITPVVGAEMDQAALAYAYHLSRNSKSVISVVNSVSRRVQHHQKHNIDLNTKGPSLNQFNKYVSNFNGTWMAQGKDEMPFQAVYNKNLDTSFILNMANARRDNVLMLNSKYFGLSDLGYNSKEKFEINCPVIFISDQTSPVRPQNILFYTDEEPQSKAYMLQIEKILGKGSNSVNNRNVSVKSSWLSSASQDKIGGSPEISFDQLSIVHNYCQARKIDMLVIRDKESNESSSVKGMHLAQKLSPHLECSIVLIP